VEGFEGIARSRSMLALLDEARKAASVTRPVLITGERGTGKELVARFVHAASDRADGPFVAINCAAFTDELLNAEIYGHEKGAFTGAGEARRGRLEQADGGSLFMDEIGNMSLAFQKRILRVIEYQEFERIGGDETVRVDVRVISATNADLAELMEERLFRQDLYDRLTFAVLRVPPLRRRKEDIPRLVVRFVGAMHGEMPDLVRRTFQRETVEAMMDYYWPGNVRELRNMVERLYLYGSEETVRPGALPPEIRGTPAAGGSFKDRVEEFKRSLVLETLADAGGNQREAARALGMTYDQFRHYYRKYTRAGVRS
jgi:DNA-binding NtrC family response regulator